MLLSAIGYDVAVGVPCKPNARPARTQTSLGPTETVPVRTGYVYGAVTPPPTSEQMDKGRMADAIRDNTEPTVYGPAASAFAVLRPDINGKLYLRTMRVVLEEPVTGRIGSARRVTAQAQEFGRADRIGQRRPRKLPAHQHRLVGIGFQPVHELIAPT